MQTHDVQQGTGPWLALRRQYFTASEAPAMMGESPYMTRSELLRLKATGIEPEIDGATYGRFQAGHAAEAVFRPIAEAEIGEDLYPVTGTVEIDGLKLLASFDGLTMDERTGFEHKLWNQELAQKIYNENDPGSPHCWQLEHQLLVSDAERILFAVSDGAEDGSVWCWYTSRSERRAQLIAGWKQFAEDLAAWKPEAAEPPKPTGSAPETLPALRIEISGAVTASNLAAFKDHALAVIGSINRNLNTDQDFADAEKAVKWCGEVEDRLSAAKQHALSQTESIDQLFRTIDDISAEARLVRLELDNMVKQRKEAIRTSIVADAMQALNDHISALNKRIGEDFMPMVTADFAGAIKGKKIISSMRDAVATKLATAKIEANAIADRIQVNMQAMVEAGDVAAFPDVSTLVLKAPDDLRAIIAVRAAASERKLEEQRARIRDEEQAKAQTGNARLAAPVQPQSESSHAQTHAGATVATTAPTAATGAADLFAGAVCTPIRTGPPTLRLGQINERLAPIALTADGLASLGFPHAATDKAAKLYHEADFPRMCAALVQHIHAVCVPKPGETYPASP